ncbi:hypothetical protein EV121DRAFT_209559 [Schizophyllum commune]
MWRAFSLRSRKSPPEERHGWPGAPYDYRLTAAPVAQAPPPTIMQPVPMPQPAPMPVKHISPPTTVPPVVSTSPPAITRAASRAAAAPQSILRTSSRAAPPVISTGAPPAFTHTVQPPVQHNSHPPVSHTPHPPPAHASAPIPPAPVPIARTSSRAAAPTRGHPVNTTSTSPSYNSYPERQGLPYTEWQAALVDRQATDMRKPYYGSSPVAAVAGSEDTYDTQSITDSACSIDDRDAYPYDRYGDRPTIYDSPISYSPSDTISPLSSPFDPRAAASPADSTVVLRGALPPTRTYSGRPLGFIPLELEEYRSGEDDRASYSDESFSEGRSTDSEDDRRGRRGDRRGDYDRRRASYASTEDSSYSAERAYDRRSGGDQYEYESHALTMSRRRGRDVAGELQRQESGRDGHGRRRHGSRAGHGRGFEDDRYSILEEPPVAPPRAQEPLHALLTEEPPRAPRSRKVSAPPAPLARAPSISSPVDDAARTPQTRTRRASVVGPSGHGTSPTSWRHSAIPTRREPALESVPERRQSPPTLRHDELSPHVFGPRPRRSSSATPAPPPDRRSISYTPAPVWAGSDSSGSTASTRSLATPPPLEAPIVTQAEARTRKPSFIRPQMPSVPIPPITREHSSSPRDRRDSSSHMGRRDSVSISPRDRRESMSTSPRDRRVGPLVVREPVNVPPNHRNTAVSITRRPSASSQIRPSATSPVRHAQPAPVYPPESSHAQRADHREPYGARQRTSRRFSDTDAPRPSSPDPLPVPPPSNRRRHSDGEQTPTDGFRGVKWREGLVLPSPIMTRDRRKGWYNRRGDQLWTNEGAFRPALTGEEYPPDLDGYPEAGEGWMNEEGKRIDMKHRLVPKQPLRSVLKTNSGSLL